MTILLMTLSYDLLALYPIGFKKRSRPVHGPDGISIFFIADLVYSNSSTCSRDGIALMAPFLVVTR